MPIGARKCVQEWTKLNKNDLHSRRKAPEPELLYFLRKEIQRTEEILANVQMLMCKIRSIVTSGR